MKRNKYIFYVLAFLQGLVFYSSITTLYRTTNGITLFEMGIIEGFMSLFVILFEIPFGMICDRIGYKKTMIISNCIYFLSKVVFYFANGFTLFLIERLLLAIAVSGLSGCDSSLLYLSINEDEATGVFGKQSMFGVMGMVVASLSFSLFFSENIKMSALATIFPYFIAFILTFFIYDIKDDQKSNMTLNTLFHSLKDHKEILLVLMSSVLLTDTTHTLTVFYNQLQYERAGISIQYFGVIFMLLQLLGMTSGLLGKITESISKEKLALSLFLIAAITSFSLIFIDTPVLSILCLMILSCVEVLFFPILNTIENESIKSHSRATILSFYSLIINISTIFTSISFGTLATHSLESSYMLGFVFCIVGYGLFTCWMKINNHTINS